MKVNFRKANLDDLDALCSLWEKLDESHSGYCSYYDLSKDPSSSRRKFIREQLKSRETFIYLAEHKEKIIGFVLGRLEDRPPIFKIKKVGVIGDLFVEKRYRRKGVGSGLTKILLKEFSKRKLKFTKLTVDIRNLTAIGLYRKCGFKDIQLKMVKNP